MKKFLSKIFLYTLILSIVNIYSYWIVEKYYHSGSDYSDVSLAYDHYILADSHANALIGETEKYGIHHFAYGSDSYFDMKRKLNYLINNTNLETVFITVSDQALSDYRVVSNNLDRSIYFVLPSDYENYFEYSKEKYIKRYVTLLNPNVRSLVRSYSQNLVREMKGDIERKVLSIRSNESSDLVIAERKEKINQLTWTELSKSERIESANSRFQTQFPSFDESQQLKEALSEIIEISKYHDIRLIGIKYPMSNEYLDLLKENNISFSAAEMLENAGYEVYDFKKHYASNQSVFVNSDHLRRSAGDNFSDLFNDILQRHEQFKD